MCDFLIVWFRVHIHVIHSEHFSLSVMSHFLVRIVLGSIFNAYWTPCLKWVMGYLMFDVFFNAGRVRDSFGLRDNYIMFLIYFILPTWACTCTLTFRIPISWASTPFTFILSTLIFLPFPNTPAWKWAYYGTYRISMIIIYIPCRRKSWLSYPIPGFTQTSK